MDSIKQNIASEENDIFASKKRLSYKALNIKINATLFPNKPRNISFTTDIDPEYKFVDGLQIFSASAVSAISNDMVPVFNIRTEHETILSDKVINHFNCLSGLSDVNSPLIFVKNEDVFFPTLIKGSGKKIIVEIKNINWSDEYIEIVDINMNIVFRQVNNPVIPKFVYDILKKDFFISLTTNTSEYLFNINTSYKEIIGFSFSNLYNSNVIKEISLNTDNLNILNKLPNQLFTHSGILNKEYFTSLFINDISNINFKLGLASDIGYSGFNYAYFLVRKPFVQPY